MTLSSSSADETTHGVGGMRVPRSVYLILFFGIMAASQSGNIIRLGSAHPFAIASWRLVLAAVMLAPLAGRGLARIKGLTRAELAMLSVAGVMLTLHFFAWVAAVQHTSVANAALFFLVNPIITSVAGFLIFKERLTRNLIGAMALGLAGAFIIGWRDFSVHGDHLTGDLLAMGSSVLFTVYFLLGKRLARCLPLGAYVAYVYGIAGLVGFAVMATLGIPFFEYSQRTWMCFLLMALMPTMMGHTAVNYAVRFIDAGRVTVIMLMEPFWAGLVAYLVWNEPITLHTLAGYTLLVLSVVVLVWEELRRAKPQP
jgi:drug/metabolite transporter (DMT)-like permease